MGQPIIYGFFGLREVSRREKAVEVGSWLLGSRRPFVVFES
jgi:hypothetical protein